MRVAVLAHGNPLAPLEAGKGEDPMGILCNLTGYSHGVNNLPGIPLALPPWEAERFIRWSEGFGHEMADSDAHVPIMSISIYLSR